MTSTATHDMDVPFGASTSYGANLSFRSFLDSPLQVEDLSHFSSGKSTSPKSQPSGLSDRPVRTRSEEAVLHQRVRARKHLRLTKASKETALSEWRLAHRRWMVANIQRNMLETELQALEKKIQDADARIEEEKDTLMSQGIPEVSTEEDHESKTRRSGFTRCRLPEERPDDDDDGQSFASSSQGSGGTPEGSPRGASQRFGGYDTDE
ncbi:unnamed protein product [Somion occarium]|uniref:BZIP domain-containing protein n=1 Tax=Somion occarium TaxID=3059160 RepID=A0ABP1CVI0_9APHY